MVSDTPVLVSKSEVSWLRGELKVAKSYERRLRFNIKHKVKALAEVELPLLADKGFFSNEIDVTANGNGVTILTPFLKRGKPWLGFGPRTFALPRQRSTRLSYHGTNTPIRNEVLEFHLKLVESSLTARQVSKSLLES